ncbi:Dyp-type peroxidase [Sandaracinobacteroides saxicola]|uniref:Dyp-type peroxidase n=1 Tax=Sandaracinobacteroides saxicola TaxID=2759707 RepID=A0A7G5IEF7_9SPHN|nr:Dyp-type peroxidase [Sandaracinobacteroides saxicola]QMW21749.1 Dyp-type peroxidase [Sandaracinobacteroides saxicola]
MTVNLELGDIQGNILTAYGRLGFPKGRNLLYHFSNPAAGRAFVEAIRPRVTTALRWPSSKRPGLHLKNPVVRPKVAINLAFTFFGLYSLGVPTRTLRGLPDDFIDGMRARIAILGDDILDNTPAYWDPVWQAESPNVHMLVQLNAQSDADGGPVAELDEVTQWLAGEAATINAAHPNAITLLSGHRGPSATWQDMTALMDGAQPTPFEHFGFMDAIGDPIFSGQYPDGAEEALAIGQGAVDGLGNWRPIATGEFLLGWADEAQEVPGTAMPLDFSRNGSFFSYRKLHQHVGEWDAWVAVASRALAGAWDIASVEDARALLLAKMAGRWTDGVPTTAAPDIPSWHAFNDRFKPGTKERERALVEFRYQDDPDGIRCPVTSHMRRMNTRDMLDPRASAVPNERMGSALNNRRRILRRGLPYGDRGQDDGEHGIIMLCHCASLSRQFEFVQQQWLNYGLDFNAGNDTCPIVGNHAPGARFVIAADPKSGHPPFIAQGLPQFVSTRGGDYFFAPSMTALRMIAMGVVDPT